MIKRLLYIPALLFVMAVAWTPAMAWLCFFLVITAELRYHKTFYAVLLCLLANTLAPEVAAYLWMAVVALELMTVWLVDPPAHARSEAPEHPVRKRLPG